MGRRTDSIAEMKGKIEGGHVGADGATKLKNEGGLVPEKGEDIDRCQDAKVRNGVRTAASRRGLWVIWMASVLVVVTAVALAFFLKSAQFGPRSSRFQALLSSLQASAKNIHLRRSPVEPGEGITTPPLELPQPLEASLLWMAPFASGGGYCSEAISYVSALSSTRQILKLRIEQHGDSLNMDFFRGLPEDVQRLLQAHAMQEVDLSESIVVCHSEPGAWHPPLYQTPPCPPGGYGEALRVIGRTMFETDRVNAEHVERCNRMDEVWVPSEFHLETFARSGVQPFKLKKVVQAVDVNFFDPNAVSAMKLSAPQRLVGPNLQKGIHRVKPGRFVFLSIFKWEKRKGWDILVQSYLKEFSAADNVVLYLLTNPFHSDRNFGKKIGQFVEESQLQEPPEGWAELLIQNQHVLQSDLPKLYKAADVFVLPSRGEGWGRPHVEAMAMGLPVIATNWSGMTEYMTERNSYPLTVDAFEEVDEGPFRGHLWAKPSVESLRVLMRRVFVMREEAKAKGAAAREDMVQKYSPAVVALQVVDLLREAERRAKKGPPMH